MYRQTEFRQQWGGGMGTANVSITMALCSEASLY